MAKIKKLKTEIKKKVVRRVKPKKLATQPSRKTTARQRSKKVLVKKKVSTKKSKKKIIKTKKKVRRPASAKASARQRKTKKRIVKKAFKKKPKAKKLINKKIKEITKGKRPQKSTKVIASKPRKKSVTKPTTKEFETETLFKARIKVVGIGGGGGSIVSEIGRSLEKATFVIADTDIRALKKRPGIKYFWFGEELTHGLGTGVNIDLAKQAAEEAKEKISDIFKDQDIVIFIASLGGGLGSGATQVFAEVAKKFGGITFGIFTLPFKFEGKNKARIAQNALKSLKQSLNVSLTIPNEKIFKIISADTPITEAFSVVNKSLIGSLESLIDLIYNPGIINIDFADFRTILKGRGNSAFLNTIEESGKNRADKVCERVLFNPLLQNNNFDAEKILFNISGSENLSMFEVEKVSSHISSLNPKAKIIFGISKSPKLKNKIKTTILMTGGGAKIETIFKKSEKIKIVVPEATKELLKKPDVEVKKIKEPVKSPLDNKEVKEKTKTELSKEKKQLPKNPPQKPKSNKPKIKKEAPIINKENPANFVPAFKAPAEPVSSSFSRKDLSIIETTSTLAKKAIRRSGLEIKKAEENEEKKRIEQEKEWEIPAFLRRVKFNK
jgi:cell division protein FtsZ